MTWEPGDASTLEVSAFRSDVRDEIVFVASRSAAGFFRNIPRTRRQGVEISARAAIPKQVRIFASYAYLDAEYRSGVRLASAIPNSKPALPGDRFPLAPAHRGSAGLGVAKLAGSLVLDAEIAVNAVSRQFLRGDDANDFAPLDGYATTGLRFAVEHPRVAVTAHIVNLFGRRYETFGIFAENPRGQIGGPVPSTASVERFLTPGYPRSVTVSLRLFARAGHP